MNENVLKDIGANIVLHRRLRGITQVWCAQKARIGVATLSKIERGIAGDGVPLTTYIRIAEALNISIIELLKTTDVKVNICVNKRLVK